jgi:LPXTG-motif cell wall-anchored protein
MKKKNNFFLLIGLLFLILLLLVFFKKNTNKGSDFKIGILADDGVALVSISKDRKMINILKIDSEAKLWIPGGLGWYRNSVIKKILQQEKKIDLLSEIIFYNFGYKADKLLYIKKVDDWKNIYWWKLIYYNNFLTKEETVKSDIDLSEDFLDEIMVRDFAETKIIEEDLKLSIINTTNVGGLASFMTKRFERLGFSVVLVGNDINEDKKTCRIIYGSGVGKTLSLSLIKEILNCQLNEDFGLNSNEVEIYFDDHFSSVIKYPSYNK